MSDGDNSGCAARGKSQSERIQEEVNRLLPDISFDDIEDDISVNEMNAEPIEIFSRDIYLNEQDVCNDYGINDFHPTERDRDEDTTGASENCNEESVVTSLKRDKINDDTSERFDEVYPEESGSSMEVLMQAALKQLSVSSGMPALSSNSSTDNEDIRDYDTTKPHNAHAESIRRASFDASLNCTSSINEESRYRERNIGKSIQSENSRLFEGLSAHKHDTARRRYLPEGSVTLNFGIRGEVNLDDLLNNMNTPDVDISRFYDTELDDKDERNVALLKRLESMSRRYGESQKSADISTLPASLENNASSLSPMQFSTSKCTYSNYSTSKSSSKVDFCDSTDDVHKRVYLDFVPKSQRKWNTNLHDSTNLTKNVGTSTNSTKLEHQVSKVWHGNQSGTVFLDLRNSKPNSTSKVVQKLVTWTPSTSDSEESSNEEEMGLWLDQYRQARSAKSTSHLNAKSTHGIFENTAKLEAK